MVFVAETSAGLIAWAASVAVASGVAAAAFVAVSVRGS
jgi:hypothetical protein